MSVPRCKFYLQGNCYYGTSCRFLHEERGNRPNNQYYDDYRPKNHRHGNQSNYESDHYERKNYQSGGRNDNYHSKKDYNYKNNYNQRQDYYEDDYSSNNYDDDNGSMNKYQSNKNYNVKNYYKDNDFNEGRNNISDHKYNKSNNYNNKNYQEKSSNNYHKSHQSNRYNDSENQFNPKHNQVTSGDRERKLKVYENEIKTFQNHIKELIKSNMWPLTCCHPIGNAYPIQPVGCLNFIEVSFEEIRCDYYIMKSVCAIPEMIHNQTVGDVMKKAQKLKSDIVSLTDRVLDDLIATFEKCEESKTNNAFVNSIQVDNNSYWDMSIREFNKPKNVVSEIDSFSFVSKNNNTKSQNAQKLKILMQNEVYGNMDCEAFAQENFTDYIPIMPPPRKYCM